MISKSLAMTNEDVARLYEENERLSEALDVAKKALLIYSHQEKYLQGEHSYYWRCEACVESPKGKSARKALAKIKEIENEQNNTQP